MYNAIGEALFRIGEITEAESWFLEALKTKPDHVPAHLTYGKMLARNVSYYSVNLAKLNGSLYFLMFSF